MGFKAQKFVVCKHIFVREGRFRKYEEDLTHFLRIVSTTGIRTGRHWRVLLSMKIECPRRMKFASVLRMLGYYDDELMMPKTKGKTAFMCYCF